MIQPKEVLKSYFETGDKPTQAQFGHLIDSLVGSVIPIFYSDLVSLKKSSKLTPGQIYRITDYITTTSQLDTQSAGHPFDVLVLALDTKNLSEQAWATHRDGDTYFSKQDLRAWKIWYSLDNDTDRFIWANKEEGRGVIYRMIDERGNDCPYDFKNIMFIRYQLIKPEDSYLTDALDDLNEAFDNGSLALLWGGTSFNEKVWDNYKKASSPVSEESKAFFTFSDVVNGVVSDKSLSIYCFENHIDTLYESGKLKLSNNLFLHSSTTQLCYYNSLGKSCQRNTFGNDCYNNSFGNLCRDNILDTSCHSNTFGNSCQHNTLLSNSYYNILKSNCYYNIIGFDSYSNIFGNSCYSNHIGESSRFNSFGNLCRDNILDTSCHSNTFGNSCQHNTFKDHCHSNTFGNSCQHNTLSVYSGYNHFGDRVQYVYLTSQSTASDNQLIRYIKINPGTHGLSSSPLTITVERHRVYEVTVGKNSSDELKQICLLG